MTSDPRFDGGETHSFMDELLRGAVPEVKLALGEIIDRENARPLPPKYARLLPETLLVVTLRSDAAESLRPIAAGLERELTDSCNRHGSLYDRRYRVQLQRSEGSEAPLYSVAVHAGSEASGAAGGSAVPEIVQTGSAGAREPVSTGGPTPARADAPGAGAAAGGAGGPAPAGFEPPGSAPPMPVTERDHPFSPAASASGWEGGRWVLIVEDDEGGEREVFRIGEPLVTVGRQSDDPRLRPSIAISGAPHVSRRQLAVQWEERDGAAGFRIYNLGLNEIRLPAQAIPGARAGKGELNLSGLPIEHTGWVPPGVPLRIGEHGPTVRIEEVPAAADDVWIDPDATVFD